MSTCQNSFNPDLSKLSKNVYVEQIFTKCLAQYSYYIEANGNAIVIDPIRESEVYLNILNKRQAKLKYVMETHFHADFVSGHCELAEMSKAEIVFGPGATAEFKIIEGKNNQLFDLSDTVKIRLIHTPGHTLESSCFVLTELQEDKTYKDLALFTGDTLFLGDVGRPDLAVKSDLTSKDLAELLFNSIKTLKDLNDEVLVLPGHGAGSACGKAIQVGSASTIGLQKKSNFYMNDNLKKEEFVEILCANIPTPPEYFFFDAVCNKKNITNHHEILKKSMIKLDLSELENLMKSGVKIIDSRHHDHVVEDGFIRNTYPVCLEMSYAIWCATLFSPNSKVALITDPGKEEESITRLTRVGFENILGYLDGGINTWKNAGKELLKLKYCDLEESKKIILNSPELIFDCRKKTELENPGSFKNVQKLQLHELESKTDELKQLDKMYVLCKSGNRALIAGSILRSHDWKNDIIIMKGGFDALFKDESISSQVIKY